MILSDPTTRYRVRKVLEVFDRVDPCDAVHDVELVLTILRERERIALKGETNA